MLNPFEALGKTGKEEPEGEEVGGSFSCQERGCYNVAHEAIYFREQRLLLWSCEDGHEGKIEGFVIE